METNKKNKILSIPFLNKFLFQLKQRIDKFLIKHGDNTKMATKTMKKMIIEIDQKDLEKLQALYGVKSEIELVQMTVSSFVGLLDLKNKVQTIPIAQSSLPTGTVVESPASKIYTQNDSTPISHVDKESNGQPVHRLDTSGKPIIENQLLTNPKSVSPEVQARLEKMRKAQEENQKKVLANKRNKTQTRTAMVG